jgi:hypothetical protein
MNNLLTKHILEKSKELEGFQIDLLEWYDEYKRELPWRTNSSLYKTVVSEFMLKPVFPQLYPILRIGLKDFLIFTPLLRLMKKIF